MANEETVVLPGGAARRRGALPALAAAAALAVGVGVRADDVTAAPAPPAQPPAAEAGGEPPTPPAPIGITPDPSIRRMRVLDINEFRVEGVTQLTTAEVETTVYPFLGPARPIADVESARAALEKAYADKGYQTVSVVIPQQTVRGGVVLLQVAEGTVGRLRVRGSRWFSLGSIKRQAPSVAEGTVPNFNGIMRDILVLNQLPDRRVTPALRAGAAPGTIDVDLNVQDTLPLHGSVEWNDRHSAHTTRHRVNVAVRYDNLWQLGHSLSFSAQLAPQRLDDGEVFSGSYLIRFPETHWFSLTATATIQQSSVSTLGAAAVQGRGRIFGGRATFTLPAGQGFFHSVTVGADYKLFLETISVGEQALRTPLHYWPVTAQYSAAWSGDASQTQAGVSVTFNLRGLSSGPEEFDAKRYQALGSFIYYRADASRTDELPGKFQLAARINGQYSRDPLIGPEQIVAGGAESVRGYVESQVVGDYGAVASVELRSPSLMGNRVVGEWRFLVFTEGAWLAVHRPLAEQRSTLRPWGAGGGTRLRLFGHSSVAVDVGVPLRAEGDTRRWRPRAHLRVSAEF